MRIETLERRTPLHRQIYEQLHDSIVSKELPPGARIPCSKDLSARFGAAAWTVQLAMSALEKEGLIERRQRVGSFVRSDKPRLERIGIYYDVDFWNGGGMDYYRLLYGKLQAVLEAEHISYRLFHGGHEKDHFPKELISAAKSFEIQALLTPLVSHLSTSAFEELGIPVINPGAVNQSCDYDMNMLFSLACGYLARQGCHSAGFITSTASWDTHIVEGFKAAAAHAGLQTDDRWIERPEDYVTNNEMEEFGYKAFCRLKGRGPLPEGLLVYPDSVAKGVVTGILDMRVNVPGDLKLVLHGNEGLPLFTPFPVATILSSPAQTAATMLELAQRRVAGENPDFVTLPFTLREPEERGNG